MSDAAYILFALVQDRGLTRNMLGESFYSHQFGLAFFWYFLVFALRFLQGRRGRDASLAAVFAFSACAAHVFFGFLIAFAGLTAMVWKPCFPLLT